MSISFGFNAPFSLQDVPGFPYTYYVDQLDAYNVLESWYSGEILDEYIIDQASKKQIDKYPIKINPLKGTCERHTSALFGQTLDSIRYGGMPVRILADVEKGKKKIGKVVEKALQQIWTDNGGGSLFVSNGILSQYLRGCVFTANWLPLEKRIGIFNPAPSEFVGFPKGTNYWDLREAWIVREIAKEDVRSYRVDGGISENDNKFYYLEHWTEAEYEVSINGKTLLFDDDSPQKGANVFGIVPMTYIPHIRVKGFLGTSLITEMIKGIVREMNLRWADTGDAVSDDSHQPIAMRNIRGAIKVENIDDRPVINLGGTTGLAGNEAGPDLFSVSLKTASDVMLKLGGELYNLYRREADHPAVADGEDEGSQRSSLTISTRMWPLVSHAEMERIFWTAGLTKFSKILLKMMAVKGINDIKEEHTETPLIISWAPMLPVDRTALINEVGIRSKYKLGSQEHLMSLFGDVPNIDEEMDKIREEQAAMPKSQPLGGNISDNSKKLGIHKDTKPVKVKKE